MIVFITITGSIVMFLMLIYVIFRSGRSMAFLEKENEFLQAKHDEDSLQIVNLKSSNEELRAELVRVLGCMADVEKQVSFQNDQIVSLVAKKEQLESVISQYESGIDYEVMKSHHETALDELKEAVDTINDQNILIANLHAIIAQRENDIKVSHEHNHALREENKELGEALESTVPEEERKILRFVQKDAVVALDGIGAGQ